MSAKQKPKVERSVEKKPRPMPKGRLSLYPLNLETALGAAIATGPIPVGDRKSKPKKKAR
jgi:hypothetical protein